MSEEVDTSALGSTSDKLRQVEEELKVRGGGWGRPRGRGRGRGREATPDASACCTTARNVFATDATPPHAMPCHAAHAYMYGAGLGRQAGQGLRTAASRLPRLASPVSSLHSTPRNSRGGCKCQPQLHRTTRYRTPVFCKCVNEARRGVAECLQAEAEARAKAEAAAKKKASKKKKSKKKKASSKSEL